MMIDKVKEFVKNAFKDKGDYGKMHIEHLFTAEKYVCKLYKHLTGKEAPEELRIAALSHDIERAFKEEHVYEKMYKSKSGFTDNNYREYHQRRSAKIMYNFLKNNNYPENKIEKVCKLISKHEVGGDFESNILNDADAMSFFLDSVVEHFINEKTKVSSVENVKKKIDHSYKRITNEEAKKMIYPLYKKAIEKLRKKK